MIGKVTVEEDRRLVEKKVVMASMELLDKVL
jgi:hypothetical protein